MSIDGLDKEEITKKLNKILTTDNKDGLVVSIDGKWGIGKTVFWKEYVKNVLIFDKKYSQNDIAYVSLFGQDSIESIKSEILLKVSRKTKAFSILRGFKDKYSPALEEINKMTYGIGGILGSAALSMLSDKDFEGKIICFDDFERISDKISHKDVMGLVSSLKEDKKCKIVMIMHQEKMNKNNKKLLSYDIAPAKADDKRNISLNFNTSKDENSEYTEYKEKIVDIELFYSPSIDSLFDVVKDNIKDDAFKEYAIKYFKDTDIKNIRVMKRVVTALNDFNFIKDWDFLHENSERQIVENILEVSTVYALYHFSDLKSLHDYTVRKATHHFIDDKISKFPVDDRFEAVLDYIYYDREYTITPTTEVLEKYIKTSKIDIEKLMNLTKEDFKVFSSSKRYDDIIKLGRKYLDDYSFNSKDYSEQLFNLLKEDTKTIISLVQPNNFIFYIEELIRLDKDKKVDYDNLLMEAAKHYIDDYLAKDDNAKSYRESEYNTMITYNEALEKYADEAYKKIIKSKIIDMENINKAISNLSSSSYYTADINLVKFLTKEQCKKFLEEEKNFVEYSFEYLRHSNIPELKGFRESLINALKELANENEDLTYRIERMFKIAKIPIEKDKSE
ncbi:MAG: P-loop NTPase fold protein [Sulfuricurvum sp.]|nr:P-loop NTPase fold protein [Sulfuricurvum sp.]